MNVIVIFCTMISLAGGLMAIDKSGPLRNDIQFIVERGESFSSVATRLERNGVLAPFSVLTGKDLMLAAVKALDMDNELKAGEYEILAHSSIRNVLSIITSGQSINRSITIPEGWTVWQAVGRINETEELEGVITEHPPEGELFPDTYFFLLGDDRQAILNRMLAAQDTVFDTLWANRSPNLPYKNAQEALIMASIIERETSYDHERDVIASVYINRLKDGWRLQADPTVMYGITNGKKPLRRGLKRSELQDTSNPYNTYKIHGLPIGPISNPGKASIKAALNPVETDYYFFVIDCDGGHIFSNTLRQHNVAVAKYRECEASLAAPETPETRPAAPTYIQHSEN